MFDMTRVLFGALAAGCLLWSVAFAAAADSFPGDTAIYLHSGARSGVAANVLFLVDNSLIMHSPESAGEESRIALVRDALLSVVDEHRSELRFGVMELGRSRQGGRLVSPVVDLANTEAYDSFTRVLKALDSDPPVGEDLMRPLAEALYDARFYFDQDRTSHTTPLSESEVADSPIEYPCQKNIVILISGGDSVGDSSPALCAGLPVADADHDGHPGDVCRTAAYGEGTHLADDVARFAYAADLSSVLDGRQNLITHTLLVFQPDSELLRSVAEDGQGIYRQANSVNGIRLALAEMLSNIVAEVNASFTTPAVPVHPENRTFSGSRVYLGFFKPVFQSPWLGNLKKFGLNTSSQLVDRHGALAVCPDSLDSSSACEQVAAGGFSNAAVSYWSSGADAGRVEQGGAGEVLLSRGPTLRNIYSNLSDNPDLAAPENAFNLTSLSAERLGYAHDRDAHRLIRYLYGYDAYDEDGDGDADETRDWILGDILHSQPAVVHYHSYPFSAENEADPAINQSVIFVGGNDGMLHAFRDADGQELWAFIPDNLLSDLSGRVGTRHVPLVDASVAVYLYDHDRDGNVGTEPEQARDDLDPAAVVDTGQFDKVILLFGERRGGGAYYALDVTEPTAPKFLWKLDRTTVDGSGRALFPHLGETWSEPSLALVRIGSSVKVAAFVGAGYDPVEDSRFGAAAGFPDPLSPQEGAGAVTSAEEPPAGQIAMQGRGVYAFALASCDAHGVPWIGSAPEKIWGYTFDDNPRLDRAIPAQITVLDSDYDGYADRLYVADLGGRLWRFNLADSAPGKWSGDIIFTPHSASGRKVFHRPSVVQQGEAWMLAFGSGDRAHPLNTAVTDRFYLVKDQGQTTACTIADGDLVDVTTDLLQSDETTVEARQSLLDRLNSPTGYGWYIDLDRPNQAEQPGGEKVLSAPVIFNNVVYFTTYLPDAEGALAAEPCVVGNPGRSYLYALDVRTGEAVLNFYLPNDDEGSTVVNERALAPQGKILRRDDRSKALGKGIPSGVVVVLPPGGNSALLIGSGGRLLDEPSQTGGAVFPLYWKEW